jgi:hypothetical protein
VDLSDVRARFPQYDNLTDKQLADALHAKFYSDIPKADFYERIGLTKPKSGFGAAARASVESLKGEAALLGGKLGLISEKDAQRYQAEQEDIARGIFRPTKEGWTEAPLTKFGELLGGSLPYMVAPVAAGAAAIPLGAAAPIVGTAGAGLASLAQFTGTNLARQLEAQKERGEEVSLERASGAAAAAAAVPQAALDIVSLKALPLVRNLFKSVGKDITEAEAKRIAEQGFKQTVADYAKTGARTAGIEGLTEAGQQYFERLQAGLSISDPDAREEYVDSFIGGAVLGAGLSPVGRFVERGGEQGRAERKLREVADEQRRVEREDQAKAEAEEAEKRKQPEYLRDLQARYTAVRQEELARKTEIDALKKSGDPADDALAKEKKQELNNFYKTTFNPVRDEYNKAGGSARFKQFAEQERVAGMSPEEYMLEQVDTKADEQKQQRIAQLKALLARAKTANPEAAKRIRAELAKLSPREAKEEAPVTLEEMGMRGAAEPVSDLMRYAQDRMSLADEQTNGTANANDYVDYLAQNPTAAVQLIAQKVQLPNLGRAESNLILKALRSKLTEQNKEELAQAEEDAARAQAKPEGMTLDEYQAQLQEMGYMQPRQEEVQYDTTGKRMREQMTAPIQEQFTLGFEQEGLKQQKATKDVDVERTPTEDGGERTVAVRASGEPIKDVVRYRYTAEVDGEPVNVRVERDNLTGETEAFFEQGQRPVGYGLGIGKLVQSGVSVEDALKRVAPLENLTLQPIKVAPTTAPVERVYTREQKLDAPALVDMLRTAQKSAPDDNARRVLEGLENNVDTLARDKDDAAEVADYIRRMSLAPEQKGVSIQPLQDILAKQEQAKRSETEALTQLARRRLTEEEQGALFGTSLGPRKDVSVVKGEAGEKIANIAQQAKIGTPIREATDELVRAVQTELPFTYGGGRRTAPTSVAFNNWRDFSDYLGSEGLQALRAASADVSNKAYPNIHRTGVLVNQMMARAADIRAQADALKKARQAIIGRAPEEAEAARKLLQETADALEKSLKKYTPDPKLIEGIRTAREKLTVAQNLKATLLAQMQQNANTLETAIAAYEEALAPTTIREKGQAPTVALGYEVVNIKEREAAKQQAVDARDRLKKAIDDFVAHQAKLDKAQRDVNFIGPDTSAPVRAELTRRLNDVIQEEKRLRNTVGQANERFMRFVARSMKGATPPSLRESTFKNFLVEEAKLTDMINGQQRQINGLRLNLNNAMMRVNAANVTIENMPEVAKLRQGLRQGLLQAEALDREMRADLTERLERPDVREREQAERRLTGEAGALETKARAAQRAGERLAAERPTGAPKKEVTAEERQEADRKEREAKQRELEIKQGTAETVDREQVTMEVRRKLRQEITDKADKLDALLNIAEDPERTLDERVAATNEFQKLYDETYGKLARRDAKIGGAMKRQAALIKAIQEVREQMDAPSLLSENQRNRLKNKPEELAEREAKAKSELQSKLNKLMSELGRVSNYLSKNRGIERTKVLTKAERAEVESERMPEGEVMPPGAERIARTQTQKRQVGPVVKQGKVAPGQLRTGTEESRAGETRATTRNQPVESGQRAQAIKVPPTKDEQRTLDIAATRNRLKQIETQLNYMQANPSATAEGKTKQKNAKAALSKEKAELDAKLADLLKQQEAVVAEERAIREEMGIEESIDTAKGPARVDVVDTGAAEEKTPTVSVSTKAEPLTVKRGPVNVSVPMLMKASGFTAKASDFNGKTFAEAARMAAERTPSSARKELFLKLAEVFDAAPKSAKQGRIYTTDGGRSKRGAIGGFLPRYNVVFTPADGNTNYLQVMLHELTHAATYYGLTADPELAKKVDALRLQALEWAGTKEGKAYLRKHSMGLLHKGKDGKRGVYGLTNIDEFLAELYSNREFQKMLAQIPSNMPQKSLLARALEYISNIFKGITGAEKSMLIDAMVLADDVLEKTKKEVFGKGADTSKLVRDKDESLALMADIVSTQPKYNGSMADAGLTADKMISQRPGAYAKFKQSMLGLGFRTRFLDALAPLEKVSGMVGDAVKGMQMMYYLRMYGMRMNFTSLSLSEGVPQLVEKKRRDGGTEWIIESVPGMNIKQIVERLSQKDVIKAAGSADAANRLFTLYLAKLRADNKGYDKLNFGRAAAEAELKEIEAELASGKLSADDKARVKQREAHLRKTIDSLPTEADIKRAFAEIEADPVLKEAFADARSMYNEYNQNLLRFMVQTGAMSKEEADRLLKEKDYVPYYRVRNGVAELMIGGLTPVRIGNLKDSPHLQELVGGEEPIFNFLDSSVQNTSMLVDMAMRNIAVKNAMWEMASVGLAKIRKAGKRGAPQGAVEFKIDGEDWFAIVDTDHIGIPSELLTKGLAGIPTMFPQAIELMGIPARFLRRAITASPVYAGRQLFRDSLSSYMASGSNAPPVLGALQQIGKASSVDRRGITGGQVFTGTSEDKARLLQEMQEGRSGWAKAFSKLEAMSMEADAATRRAQYQSYLDQGLSEMEATFMALESMNFARRGIDPSVQFFTTLIPFMNAQIQSLDVLYRSLRGQMPMNERLQIKEKLIARGMMLAGMSMAYAMAMQDDETYKNARPDEKYNNWFVPIPGMDEKLRVPIPFELGYIFKALPEALINGIYAERGADEAIDAAKGIIRNMIPGGGNYGIPAAFKPLIEVGLGKSFFTGRDLESGAEQMQEPWARYRENTSETAKLLGRLFNISPIKIETLVSGYTGSLGMALMQVPNVVLSTPETDLPEKRVSQMPLVGTLFQPKDAAGIIDDTFDRLKDYTAAKETYEGLVEKGELAKADAYLRNNIEKIQLASISGAFRQQIGEITKAERQVRGSSLTSQEKRDLLDDLRQAKILVASSVRDSLGRIEAQ